MTLGNQPSQTVLGDMGIDLSGRDVGVAEHLLDAAEIGPMLDQMGSKEIGRAHV